jgi:predicted nucleic acid-binding Zn ribbon protein
MEGEMERLRGGLQKVVSDALRRISPSQASLMAWPIACGAAVAERTRVLDCMEGVLRVEVPDMGWRAELQNLTPQYVAAINRYTGSTVKGIQFIVKSA